MTDSLCIFEKNFKWIERSLVGKLEVRFFIFSKNGFFLKSDDRGGMVFATDTATQGMSHLLPASTIYQGYVN